MILGECPEARLLDIRFPKPIQSEVVNRLPTPRFQNSGITYRVSSTLWLTDTTPTASSPSNAM